MEAGTLNPNPEGCLIQGLWNCPSPNLRPAHKVRSGAPKGQTPVYLSGDELAWVQAAKPPRWVTHLQRNQPLHVAWVERVNEKNRCLGWVNPATRSTTCGSWNNQLLSPAFQGHVSAEGKALGRVWARGNQLSSRCAPPTPNPGQRQLPGFSEARRAPPCVAVIAGFN